MINKEKFSGIFPALVTPFDKDGKINYDSLKELMDYNIKKGVKGFYVCGTSGEVFKLSHEERKEYYKKCAEFNCGRATLIGHIGSLDLNCVLEYAKICEEYKYDAISSVTPFYFSYTKDNIIEYYEKIAKASTLPLIIYHIPLRSGINLGFDAFKRLLDNKNIIGMKFTSNDYYTFERIRNAYPDKILFNGFDEMLICGLVNGADGAIGTTYNVASEMFIDIYNLSKENKYKEAAEIQHKANDLITDLIEFDIIDAVKSALTDVVGIDCGTIREPGNKVSKVWKQKFRDKYSKCLIKK